ncbi:MAG: hypothetical protein ACYC3H_02205 [Bellilinea sp.]
MKKVIIGLGIALVVAGLVATGVMAASWFWTGRATSIYGWGGMPMMRSLLGRNIFGGWSNQNNATNAPYGCTQNDGSSAFYGPMMGGRTFGRSGYGGMMGARGFGGMMGARGFGGMMGGYRGSYSNSPNNNCPYITTDNGPISGTRLTIEQAQSNLEENLVSESNLALVEVMEFESNFYGVVVEKDSGRGAMELLVDPYSGAVYPEHGPNMMWNEKYGHMGSWYSTSGNALTLDEARAKAQAALDKEIPGAVVEGMGIEFYGYFTFDYAIDDTIAGMLSVRNNGQTWIHNWHGNFIGEVELDE